MKVQTSIEQSYSYYAAYDGSQDKENFQVNEVSLYPPLPTQPKK